ADGALAQGSATIKGTWGTGFNHSITLPTGTDPTVPFQGTGFVAPTIPGHTWGVDRPNGGFNAIHMALIPKGVYQGKVVVWDRYSVILKPSNALSQSDFWACQSWSIIDPYGGTPIFRNFLLPLQHGTNTNTVFANLFCSATPGHNSVTSSSL